MSAGKKYFKILLTELSDRVRTKGIVQTWCYVGVRVGMWMGSGSGRCGVRWAQAHMSGAKAGIAQTLEFVMCMASGDARAVGTKIKYNVSSI